MSDMDVVFGPVAHQQEGGFLLSPKSLDSLFSDFLNRFDDCASETLSERIDGILNEKEVMSEYIHNLIQHCSNTLAKKIGLRAVPLELTMACAAQKNAFHLCMDSMSGLMDTACVLSEKVRPGAGLNARMFTDVVMMELVKNDFATIIDTEDEAVDRLLGEFDEKDNTED